MDESLIWADITSLSPDKIISLLVRNLIFVHQISDNNSSTTRSTNSTMYKDALFFSLSFANKFIAFVKKVLQRFMPTILDWYVQIRTKRMFRRLQLRSYSHNVPNLQVLYQSAILRCLRIRNIQHVCYFWNVLGIACGSFPTKLHTLWIWDCIQHFLSFNPLNYYTKMRYS